MSRLLAVYILLFIEFGLANSFVHAQDYKSLGMSKGKYKRVKKESKLLNTKEQVYQFLILQEGQYESTSAGFMKSNNVRGNQSGDLRITNLSGISELNALPFPGTELRKELSYPNWLSSFLNTDFLTDIEQDNHGLFYGLDSIDIYLSPTPYKNPTKLIQAILSHDFVYWSGSSTDLDEVLDDIKLKSEEKKALRDKLIKKLAFNAPNLHKHDYSIDSELVRDWIISIYATNDGNPNGSEGNWLSKLVAEQYHDKVYDSIGRRVRLAEGADKLIQLNKEKLNSIDSLIEFSIKDRAIPGCQLLVAKDGYVIYNKNYGYLTYDSTTAVSSNTIYDLASFTKPLATTQVLMFLVEEEKLDLDKELVSYLPYLEGTNKENITTKEILAHQANLYPYYPFWKKAKSEFDLYKMNGPVQAGSDLWVEPFVADSILSWAATSDLLSERIDTITHEQYMYSDVGFYLLFDLIKRLTDEPVDQYLYKNLYSKVDTDLRFNPLVKYPKDSIAPTEYDKLLRNELVQGFVHDRNAALTGGVAGQAGLFGTALDVAKLMQLHLDNGTYGGEKIFDPETIEKFMTRYFEGNRRGLGWDMPALPAGRPGDEPDGPVSMLVSDQTFGHTGFTGGMVWADPKEKLIFVFLSNRVYPSVENNKLIELNIRTGIQDLIYQALPKD